jgi:peptide/nickel transport system ATP-binding protein
LSAKTLDVQDLRTHFFTRAGVVRAVDGVSFEVRAGEVLGLVGESGCGKTVTGFSILGLVDPPGRIAGGQILFDGKDLVGLPRTSCARCAAAHRDGVPGPDDDAQPGAAHRHPDGRGGARAPAVDAAAARAKSRAALERSASPRPNRACILPAPVLRRHAPARGDRHRAAQQPKLIIADEPTTALDRHHPGADPVRAQKLCRESGTRADLDHARPAVVAGLADRICVMYAGRIVEQGSVDEVLDAPLHPYTHGLIGSVPSRNRRGSPLAQIPGMTPALLNLPPGCAFRTRCPRAASACLENLL